MNKALMAAIATIALAAGIGVVATSGSGPAAEYKDGSDMAQSMILAKVGRREVELALSTVLGSESEGAVAEASGKATRHEKSRYQNEVYIIADRAVSARASEAAAWAYCSPLFLCGEDNEENGPCKSRRGALDSFARDCYDRELSPLPFSACDENGTEVLRYGVMRMTDNQIARLNAVQLPPKVVIGQGGAEDVARLLEAGLSECP